MPFRDSTRSSRSLRSLSVSVSTVRSAPMETTCWPRRPGILSRLLGCPESVWEAAGPDSPAASSSGTSEPVWEPAFSSARPSAPFNNSRSVWGNSGAPPGSNVPSPAGSKPVWGTAVGSPRPGGSAPGSRSAWGGWPPSGFWPVSVWGASGSSGVPSASSRSDGLGAPGSPPGTRPVPSAPAPAVWSAVSLPSRGS